MVDLTAEFWYHTWVPSDASDEVKKLALDLPHGGGINGNWHIDVTQRTIKASNVYSAMDENGTYCHEYDFTVSIPLRQGKPQISELTIKVRGRQFVCCGYDLGEYLGDTVYGALEYETLRERGK